MCGIGGLVDFEQGVNPATLNAMVAALGRRGPDANGLLIQGPCGLAHARLSIIDVDGSPQPMAPAGLDLAMVYNGEIYNYADLRGELRSAGHAFETHGDTEVLLRALVESWTDALPRLDAMFAFAVWDRRRERLLLGRDALGEKPLYYAAPRPGLIVFGSEIKVVLEHPAVDRALDQDGLRQALRFRAVYGQGSLHRGIRQVEPGSWLEFSRDGVRSGRFFDLVTATEDQRRLQAGSSSEALIAQGEQMFLKSVERRLVADVPIGAFLSGGLDSSLIVAAMRRLKPGAEIRSYSVGFTGDPHSELGFAAVVAEAVGTRHRAIEVGPEAYIRRFAELSGCRDAPVSQPADIAIAEMSRIAKADVKVVLSGEGADEAFGGYPKYTLAGVPRAAGAVLGAVGPDRVAAMAGLLGLDRRRALVAARALGSPTEVERFVQWFSYFDFSELNVLLPSLGWTAADQAMTVSSHADVLGRLCSGSVLSRMQTADCLTWLPCNMLERGDRMTMAEGLEVRPPFLEKELCAFGLALPDHLKVRGRVGKWMVRRWGDSLLPPAILERPKWGFRTPLKDWFRGPMRDFLLDYITASDGLCATFGDVAAAREMAEKHIAGGVDASEALWTLLSAEVWFQDVFSPRTRDVPLARSA